MPSSLLQSLAALALLIVLAGCDAQTAPLPKTGRPVQVQKVSFANESLSRDFVGVVRARYESDLSFRNSRHSRPRLNSLLPHPISIRLQLI
jgi:hypothetical protein